MTHVPSSPRAKAMHEPHHVPPKWMAVQWSRCRFCPRRAAGWFEFPESSEVSENRLYAYINMCPCCVKKAVRGTITAVVNGIKGLFE